MSFVLSRTAILAAVLNLSVFHLVSFLKCLKLILRNRVQLLHLQNCCQNFPLRSEAYMWQRQSRYVNSSTPARWCNPDPWLRPTTHGIGNCAHIHWHASSNCQDSIVIFLPLNLSIKAPSAAPARGWRAPADLSPSPATRRHKCWAKLEWEEGQGVLFSAARIPHTLFFHPRPTHPWPPTLTFDSFVCVCLWVCVFVCASRGLFNNVGINYKLLSKHQSYNWPHSSRGN